MWFTQCFDEWKSLFFTRRGHSDYENIHLQQQVRMTMFECKIIEQRPRIDDRASPT
jgi:hypothetical protein